VWSVVCCPRWAGEKAPQVKDRREREYKYIYIERGATRPDASIMDNRGGGAGASGSRHGCTQTGCHGEAHPGHAQVQALPQECHPALVHQGRHGRGCPHPAPPRDQGLPHGVCRVHRSHSGRGSGHGGAMPRVPSPQAQGTAQAPSLSSRHSPAQGSVQQDQGMCALAPRQEGAPDGQSFPPRSEGVQGGQLGAAGCGEVDPLGVTTLGP
jgi:hypothetical protein